MNLYYPIGTIVKLSIDNNALFMISGYLTKQSDGNYFDYLAVPFPLGLIKENQYISFNRECITEVIHMGYCDDECQKILDGLDQFVGNLNKLLKEMREKNIDTEIDR